MVVTALLFAVTAALYASVGFGGGSTYNALLVLAQTDYRVLPAIALTCNIIVVTGGTFRYTRDGVMPWRRALPIALVAAPFAWAGGRTPIPQHVFIGLLGLGLLVAGLLMLTQRERVIAETRHTSWRDYSIGAGIGYFSGLVGIGGGIFLSPFLHLTRWSQARPIAATASLFILVNSIAGLIGQLMKLDWAGMAAATATYWSLALAVLVGGQLGTHMGLKLLSETWVRRLTALLVLYVAARLIWQFFTR
ncbi:sulfite exporter TauE/SafE family protein [Sphingomonas gilva]|uniref:Probable membrane transporter protein n=1 Tax=Sphingomonas gilva TaxID=2305907 RepID=A0A396RLZ7_9SPHN|nr:sulfite exporter TauE/SafE family protein [Sphingomonas gilva]RHW17269.1 sulfite exporter TauE/SafE family protein [Sphingomonas gilva]